MLVSLTSANLSYLFVVFGTIGTFLGGATFICLSLTARRIIRNRRLKIREKQKTQFNTYLNDIIKEETANPASLNYKGVCHIDDMTGIFLHYFRTLRGKKFEFLQDLISGTNLEDKITASTMQGNRGTRMQAVKTLSYLNSQSSLATIHKNLTSDDKYIQLTAARCLVRRKSIFFITPIIESCIKAFPNNHKLLADIISGFGQDAAAPLEVIINNTENETSLIACLEALVFIMPPKSTLNFSELMVHKNPAVRAATVALSSVTEHSGDIDPLKMGLTDVDISVKMRAAKTACTLKRSDLTSEFYALTSSSVMWLRYWSMRAIWASGKQGEQFVNALKTSNPMAADVALEMESGYV